MRLIKPIYITFRGAKLRMKVEVNEAFSDQTKHMLIWTRYLAGFFRDRFVAVIAGNGVNWTMKIVDLK